MPRRLAALAVAALLLLVGCSGLRLAGLRAELDRAEARWNDAGIDDYEYTFRWVCFCPFEEVRVTVEGGVVSVETLPDGGTPIDPTRYGPIEDLFAFVRDAIDQRAFSIEVTYDLTTGVPTMASVDYLQFAVDDENGFVLDGLHPLVFE
jgi:hypothetical protein